jgi:hypothetical protein
LVDCKNKAFRLVDCKNKAFWFVDCKVKLSDWLIAFTMGWGYTTKQLYKNECTDDNGNMIKIGWYKTLHNTPPTIWQLPN